MLKMLPTETIIRNGGFPSPSTQVDWFSASNLVGERDMLHRTISSATSVVSTMSWPTSFVTGKLDAWHESLQADINALKTVANFQRKYINYQATYNAFLLGTLTEDEFDVESDAYISEERKVDAVELAPLIDRLKRLLDFELTDRELGEYLEVDSESFQRAVDALGDLRTLNINASTLVSGTLPVSR